MSESRHTPSAADRAFERTKRRIGWVVFWALFVLTVLEYLAAVKLTRVLLWMIPFAIAKGALIIIYFMHIKELWHPEEEI